MKNGGLYLPPSPPPHHHNIFINNQTKLVKYRGSRKNNFFYGVVRYCFIILYIIIGTSTLISYISIWYPFLNLGSLKPNFKDTIGNKLWHLIVSREDHTESYMVLINLLPLRWPGHWRKHAGDSRWPSSPRDGARPLIRSEECRPTAGPQTLVGRGLRRLSRVPKDKTTRTGSLCTLTLPLGQVV